MGRVVWHRFWSTSTKSVLVQTGQALGHQDGRREGSRQRSDERPDLGILFRIICKFWSRIQFCFHCDLVSKVGGKYRDSIKTHEIAKLCAERLRAGDDVETVRSLAAPQLLIDNKSKGCSFACRARPSSWLAKTFGKTFDQMRFPSRR